MAVVRLNPNVGVARRNWGDETVVYLLASGDTHLLSASAGQVLDALSVGPLRSEAIAAMLGLPEDESELRELLGGLIRIGLIENCGPLS